MSQLDDVLRGYLKMFDGNTENPLGTAKQQIKDLFDDTEFEDWWDRETDKQLEPYDE